MAYRLYAATHCDAGESAGDSIAKRLCPQVVDLPGPRGIVSTAAIVAGEADGFHYAKLIWKISASLLIETDRAVSCHSKHGLGAGQLAYTGRAPGRGSTSLWSIIRRRPRPLASAFIHPCKVRPQFPTGRVRRR